MPRGTPPGMLSRWLYKYMVSSHVTVYKKGVDPEELFTTDYLGATAITEESIEVFKYNIAARIGESDERNEITAIIVDIIAITKLDELIEAD